MQRYLLRFEMQNAAILKGAIYAEAVLEQLRKLNVRLLKECESTRPPLLLLASNSDSIPSDPDNPVLSG